ncbi:MAG: MurR/RpiR family transcriptional regulator [Paracoccus sp. (in: a-proteobacteria)]|uniref:MurR/RpiR family transcriptional regulator n=1 Tax=Paracoccus sp. TaxID=267 RepID=UPI002333FC3E|nr:MurR/RpiR family transcriptional regulator [Paracoccus sp. (in: a-proteobacteria)]
MLVRDLVEKHRAEFTTAERRLIPFLKDDSLVIELQSITKLAEAAEVSTPTVIRLARKLGFDGFPALQGAIRAELAERIKQPLAKLEAPMVESGADHLINRFAEKVVQNLGQTIGQLNLADFVAAATLLSSFDRPVYLIGGRITQPVAAYFANQLANVRPRVTLMSSSRSAWPQTVMDLDDRTVLIIFDIRRYEKKMERLAEFAASQGVQIILLTDQWGSPIEKIAHHCFRAMVEAPSSWDSTLALNFLVETFVAQVQREAADASAERIRRMEHVIGATEIF